ncbi:nucleotidyltransferase domain-containing protein [Thermosynechococcus sp. HN-54]|uniref:type VII toxin-antitoxin system MntA family adenylyltransferase antitoxin n=1 Tax=Thermosynechococcus sp. HN-54 TaxID=2933959 RepID=UPI00202CD378|nr:nucleotidyltransferase domain-containing protein [Thermosynechococcus sp. HN-54]URR36385.1 nucleotidyltransferase domain-containing protein [Thermosynechococcus sp. HN-54]
MERWQWRLKSYQKAFQRLQEGVELSRTRPLSNIEKQAVIFLRGSNLRMQESTLETILAVIRRHPTVKRVVLFGSRARGDAHSGSDIDLAIAAPDMDFDEYLRLRRELAELNIPYMVDLLKLEYISDQALQENIRNEGQILYQAQSLMMTEQL